MEEDFYEQLCTPEFLYLAWQKVARKKGAAGCDGQTINSFASCAQKNITKLSQQLQRGDYEPVPLRYVEIPKEEKGRFRSLNIPTVRDRIVALGINIILQEIWNEFFSPLSFAYKNGTGASQAIQETARQIREGKTWFVKGDIRGCFDSLNWNILSELLKEWLPDQRLRAVINKIFRAPVVKNGRILNRGKGVPQGSPLSPILANLYLDSFDRYMENRGFPVIRYADDWLILAENAADAETAFLTAHEILSTIMIEMAPKKSGYGSLDQESIVFLGHEISSRKIDAGPKGWQRFARALSLLKTARNEQDRLNARSELRSIEVFYGSSCLFAP